MTRPARLRVSLALALSTALVAAAVPAVQAAAGTTSGDGAAVKGRTAKAVLAASRTRPTRLVADLPDASGTARRAATRDRALSLRLPAEAAGADAIEPAVAAAAPTCEGLGLDLTSTNDRVWVHWNASDATSYSVHRQRLGGAWQKLATVAGTATSYVDRGINPRAAYTYRLDTAGISCPLGTWWTMATDDGWGEPDAVYGGAGDDGLVMAQDTYTYAMPSGGGSGYDPAFSPDGRRLAAARADDLGTWSITVTQPGAPEEAPVASFPVAAGRLGTDAAWSPDGRTIAYTSYAVDAEGDLTDPHLRTITVATGSDQPVTGGAGLIQPDWRDAATLVAAGWAVGEGLFTLPVAGGTKAPVAGTQNADEPEVAPDGRIWFVEGTADSARLRTVVPGQSPVTVETSTTGWFEQPKTTTGGQVFYVRVDENDPADANDDTFTVVNHGVGETAIGAPRDETLGGFVGYDVRQPKSKGTSDYVGDANPEILGKDTAGRLFAYHGDAASPVAGRTSMGGGWNMFNLLVAPGDLDGDNRADVLGRKPDGTLWLYHGLGGGKVQAGVQVGSGWGSYVLVAPGDFDGDGVADLLGRDSAYRLWLYPGRGDGRFGARTLVTSGWGGFSAIIGFGDFNLDGEADILGRERSSGYLYLYPGTGTGGITGRTRLGAGWNSLNAFAAPEFYGVNPGLFGRRADGRMLYYQVVGDGRFDSQEVYDAGGGWAPFQITG